MPVLASTASIISRFNMIAVGYLEGDHDHDPDLQFALPSARTFTNNTEKFLLLNLYASNVSIDLCGKIWLN